MSKIDGFLRSRAEFDWLRARAEPRPITQPITRPVHRSLTEAEVEALNIRVVSASGEYEVMDKYYGEGDAIWIELKEKPHD